MSERVLIGTILVDPAGTMIVAADRGVRPEWFEDDAFAAIYETAIRAYRDGVIERRDGFALVMDARKLVLGEEWKRRTHRTGSWLAVDGWQEYVVKAHESAIRPSEIGWHVKNLRDTHSRRALSKTFYAANNEPDVLRAFQMLQNKLTDVMTAAAERGQNMKRDVCAAIESREAEAFKMRVDPEGPRDLKWIPGIATPWYRLTKVLFGFSPRLHILAARPSVGKTSLAVNFMRFWADTGIKVVFNSLDMPPEDLIDRMRIERSRISFKKKIFTPTRDDLKRLQDASVAVVKSSVEVVEHSYVEDFCLDVVRLHRAGKCDIALVDYVQLLNSYAVNNANEYERVSFVAKKLKETANHYRIPIVALCQLNRASAKAENSEPGLADLRGSGELEQCASTVMILHRDQEVCEYMQNNPYHWFYENRQYGEKVAAESIDAIWLNVAKNQNGRTGRLPFIVNKPYFTWKLADYTTKPKVEKETKGVVTITKTDSKECFMRFHRDWRADTWEKSLEGATVPYAIDGRCGLPILMDEQTSAEPSLPISPAPSAPDAAEDEEPM